MGSGTNLVTTVIGFGMSATFIVFMCTRINCRRIRGSVESRMMYKIESRIDIEQENILLWQRRCEDALYSLLTFGARRPMRHLALVAVAKIISKGDGISVYARANSL
ncbi:hypothetical protein HN51_040676 [Arachis hypogaea]